MKIKNGKTVQIAIPALKLDAAARVRDEVIRVESATARSFLRTEATIDGKLVTVSVEPEANYHSRKNPFLEVAVLEEQADG